MWIVCISLSLIAFSSIRLKYGPHKHSHIRYRPEHLCLFLCFVLTLHGAGMLNDGNQQVIRNGS